jgi:hypothetical protein
MRKAAPRRGFSVVFHGEGDASTMPRNPTRTDGSSAREHAKAYIRSICYFLMVSSLPFPCPPDFFVVCRSDFNVVPFLGVEDRGAEGVRIGHTLTTAR